MSCAKDSATVVVLGSELLHDSAAGGMNLSGMLLSS